MLLMKTQICAFCALLFLSPMANAFSTMNQMPKSRVDRRSISLQMMKKENSPDNTNMSKFLVTAVIGAGLAFPGGALADEYGREIEAPTLFTGETTMICTKRGPLGACLQTVERTIENDNDKATKYFKDPEVTTKEKYSAYQLQKIDNGETTKIVASSEGNDLIEKLRQQSLDNKEKNDRIVRAKTLQNDMGASFGPLDNQVAILNSDGETFTLLKGAQAMRLKKAGYIKDKRFVTQPSQEIIDEAFDAPEEGGLGAVFGSVKRGLFGSNDD